MLIPPNCRHTHSKLNKDASCKNNAQYVKLVKMFHYFLKNLMDINHDVKYVLKIMQKNTIKKIHGDTRA